jgi:hypothetical protein
MKFKRYSGYSEEHDYLLSSYYGYLCSYVETVRKELLMILFNTPFIWIITGDDNRAQDGKELRVRFIDQYEDSIFSFLELNNGKKEKIINDFMEQPCRMLEMLIAFSEKCAFTFEDTLPESSPEFWFSEFLDNLDITYEEDPKVIDDVLDKLNTRKYERNGTGGLFPIVKGSGRGRDQRNIELWYQFNEYIINLYGHLF